MAPPAGKTIELGARDAIRREDPGYEDYVAFREETPALVGSDPLSVFEEASRLEKLAGLGEGPLDASGFFRTGDDYMSGLNRVHNKKIHELVTQEATRVLEERRGESLSPEEKAEVREYVHRTELRHYKVNDGGQRNGNAGHSNFQEMLENTLDHFGGRVSRSAPDVLETNEDVHLFIEQMIDERLNDVEGETLLAERGVEVMADLRAALRTRLRAEFSALLMNEWGSERLEDIIDSMRNSILLDFEDRAGAIIADTMGEEMKCAAE